MTHLRINRRTLLTGTVALGTVGLLAACGGGSDKKISGKAASSTEEIVKNLEINKQDRSSLKQGGEFRASVSAIGPNFNILTQSGYTTENLSAFGGACNIPSAIGFTSLSPAGEYSLNDDYVSDYKAETVDGVQTITFKLNSKAVFNDGTPVDIEAIRAAWTVYRNPDDGYNVIAAPFWQQVASIDPVDGDKTRSQDRDDQADVSCRDPRLARSAPRTDRQGALQQRLREQAHGSVLVRPLQDWRVELFG